MTENALPSGVIVNTAVKQWVRLIVESQSCAHDSLTRRVNMIKPPRHETVALNLLPIAVNATVAITNTPYCT